MIGKAVFLGLLAIGLPAGGMSATASSGLDFATPDGWSAQQHELAGKAIVLLIAECPAIKTYIPDIESARVKEIDQTDPINAHALELVLPHPWTRVLEVSISTTREPKSKLLRSARNDGANFFAANGGVIDFDLGTGEKPGIFMQTSLFPESLCGAKNPVAVRTQDRSALKSSPPDTFISVPALKLLDQL